MDNEQHAIEILSYLVTEYRRAFNHGGDYESIEKTRQCYCESIKESWKLTENDLYGIYLKGKILADEKQLVRHQRELDELENKQYHELDDTVTYRNPDFVTKTNVNKLIKNGKEVFKTKIKY